MDPDAERTDGEIGSTAGRTHAEVLEQTLGRERGQEAALRDGPPTSRGTAARAVRPKREE